MDANIVGSPIRPVPPSSTQGPRVTDSPKSPATPEVASSQTEADKQQIPYTSVADAAKKVEDFVQPLNSALKFEINDELGVTVVKVVDQETNETIRQIPSEEMLQIARTLDKLQGLLVHNKV